jgi:hypothetical protein
MNAQVFRWTRLTGVVLIALVVAIPGWAGEDARDGRSLGSRHSGEVERAPDLAGRGTGLLVITSRPNYDDNRNDNQLVLTIHGGPMSVSTEAFDMRA